MCSNFIVNEMCWVLFGNKVVKGICGCMGDVCYF